MMISEHSLVRVPKELLVIAEGSCRIPSSSAANSGGAGERAINPVLPRQRPLMPITPFLKNQAFGPDQIPAINEAFLKACARLGLSDRTDPATELVASKVIHIAQSGVRNPSELCRRVLVEFGVEGDGEADADRINRALDATAKTGGGAGSSGPTTT